ncbi:26554_t:CDS:1, partial [Racocetra persica]
DYKKLYSTTTTHEQIYPKLVAITKKIVNKLNQDQMNYYVKKTQLNRIPYFDKYRIIEFLKKEYFDHCKEYLKKLNKLKCDNQSEF